MLHFAPLARRGFTGRNVLCPGNTHPSGAAYDPASMTIHSLTLRRQQDSEWSPPPHTKQDWSPSHSWQRLNSTVIRGHDGGKKKTGQQMNTSEHTPAYIMFTGNQLTCDIQAELRVPTSPRCSHEIPWRDSDLRPLPTPRHTNTHPLMSSRYRLWWVNGGSVPHAVMLCRLTLKHDPHT